MVSSLVLIWRGRRCNGREEENSGDCKIGMSG